MAEFDLSTKPGPQDASTTMFAWQVSGKKAGEALTVLNPVELRADDKLYKHTGTRPFLGMAARTVVLNAGDRQPITVHGLGMRFHAHDAGGLEPGKVYYLSATVGKVSDVATARDAKGAFIAVSKHDLMVAAVGQLA